MAKEKVQEAVVEETEVATIGRELAIASHNVLGNPSEDACGAVTKISAFR